MLNDNTVTINAISKIYQILPKKFRKVFHRKWQLNPLGLDKGINGYASVEIDESEIIGNSQNIYWIFDIIDNTNKEALLFSVLNNQIKERLLPLVQIMFLINIIANLILSERNDYFVYTRVYSDIFSTHQSNNFAQLGYILKRLNHLVLLGYGFFHRNTIEDLWAQIKRLTIKF